MWYIYIIIFSLFVIFSFIGSNSIKNRLSKNEITNKLIILAKSIKPSINKIKLSAMCYDISIPSEKAEYICPKCGNKTLYTDKYIDFISIEIPSCRDIIKNATKVSAILDESIFCKVCSPNLEKPYLKITINYPQNPKKVVICLFLPEDKRMIISEFQEDKKIQEKEYDLKNYKNRIKKLLGI